MTKTTSKRFIVKFKIDLKFKIKSASWRIKFFKAQSLLELLVAIAVGTIMIGGSVLLMVTSLSAYQSIKQRTAINSLSRQEAEIIIALTHNNWHYLTSVCDCEAIGVPGMGCSLVENNGQWEVYVSEDGCLPEEGVLNNIAYRRYYAILPVSRTNGEIDNEYNDEHEDFSTKKVVIVVEYGKSQDNYTGSESLSFYLTRSSNNQVIQQTDWSGGQGQTGPLPNPGNKFDTSDSNINYASTTGSIYQTTATSTVSSLTSSIIDTGIEGGAGFNSLLWQGSLGSGGSVKFQIAFSNAASGPWTYYGPTATSDYYQPNPNVSIAFPTTGSASPQNNRYFRYKVFLSTTGTSPQINDIIINWSP